MLANIKKNYFIIFSIFSGIPLFFIPNAWDGLIFDYGFLKENLTGIETFYKEIGSPLQLIFYYLIFFIKKTTFLPHEFLFDFFTIVALILFSFEIKKYSEIVFNLNNSWSNLCAVFAISFPIWHSLVSINLGFYLICFYFALLGYRLFISKKLFTQIIGILIILFSFSLKSNFSFVIGLSLAHNLKLFFDGKAIKKNSLIFVILLSISAYIIDLNFFPPYGHFNEYNEVKIKNLYLLDVIKNFFNFSTFFVYYLWIPILYFLLIKFKRIEINVGKFFNKKDLIDFFSISIIFISAISPYLLVNRSSDLFFFSEYESRHSYLLTVSFSLFFVLLLKKFNDIYDFKKIHLFILALFITQNLFILSVGYYTKIESSIFRNDFVEKLKKMEEPPGGNIQIVSSHIPGHLRHWEVSYYFYKAYNKASWYGVGIYNEEVNKNFKIPDWILEREDYKTEFVLDDYSQQCNITIKLTNEINKYDRLLKFYIFNHKNYFNIKILKISC